MPGDFGTGKTIFVLAIVVTCFAVLWPKVFYPMLTATGKQPVTPRQETVSARSERPSHLYPDMLHPALREKGRALPQRTIEKQARPGPMPGVRPPMGGGHISPSLQPKATTGSMSVVMPLYTVGIIIFFLYTIMKVLFKKGPEEDDKAAKLKDFHLEPEYRKYVFDEEYLDTGSDVAPPRRAEQREASGLRRRAQPATADTKIEDEQMDQLRRRLEDTERAMERLMSQMGSVSDKLTAAKITEVLSQAQAQAKLLKAATTSSKGSSPDMDGYELIQKGPPTGGSCLQKPPPAAQQPSQVAATPASTCEGGDTSTQLAQSQDSCRAVRDSGWTDSAPDAPHAYLSESQVAEADPAEAQPSEGSCAVQDIRV